MNISTSKVLQESMEVESLYLARTVLVDFYFAGANHGGLNGKRGGSGVNGAANLVGDRGGCGVSGVGPETSLLLINDGQELGRLGLAGILEELDRRESIDPLLCVGIHAGAARKMEYGSASRPDYQGWGRSAGAYSQFVLEELIPAIRIRFGVTSFREKAFAGFSLGALSAMDIVWHNPQEFALVG